MKVKVYLNEGEDHFFGFHNKFANSPELHWAAEFELEVTPELQGLIDGKPIAILERIFEQLNVGGDIVPAEDWTTAYRAAGNRSLSVGDVIVVGEAAYTVASFGWDKVSGDDLGAAIKNYRLSAKGFFAAQDNSNAARAALGIDS